MGRNTGTRRPGCSAVPPRAGDLLEIDALRREHRWRWRKRRSLRAAQLGCRGVVGLGQFRQLLDRLFVVRRQFGVGRLADLLGVRVVVGLAGRLQVVGRPLVVLRGVGLDLDHRLGGVRHPRAARVAVLAQGQRGVARAAHPVVEGVGRLALPALDLVVLQALADLVERLRRVRQLRGARLDRLRVEGGDHREQLLVRVAVEVRRRHQIVPFDVLGVGVGVAGAEEPWCCFWASFCCWMRGSRSSTYSSFERLMRARILACVSSSTPA
ncbi:hypothetical protein EDD96_4629 [Streptomyces sp. Ag109_G2-6]|nr:hypothetical protein EDD96_4629 [Streptomyces sp. Ag109_G2-6]